MKPIIINEKNRDKIVQAIEAAQGKATARTITVETVEQMTAQALNRLGLRYKTQAEGLTISVDYHAQNFPRAYKYRAESTHFTATLERGQWRLTSVSRDYTRPHGKNIQMALTDAQKAAVIEQMEGK